MKKVERRLSKTLLKMSKKFLSLEEEIENISCEGITSILFTNVQFELQNYEFYAVSLANRQNLSNDDDKCTQLE